MLGNTDNEDNKIKHSSDDIMVTGRMPGGCNMSGPDFHLFVQYLAQAAVFTL